MDFKLIAIFSFGLLISCQPLYQPLTHNTPHFNKRNQFEAGVNAGASGTYINAAYTPVKYLAVQVNGSNFPGIPMGQRYYTNYCEGAIGFYLPIQNWVFAINGGYGSGSENWQTTNSLFASRDGYTMTSARYDSKKYFCQTYAAFKSNSSGKLFQAFSVKLNKFNSAYYSGSTDDNTPLPVSYLNSINVVLLEFNYVLKIRIYKALYYNLTSGFYFGKSIFDAPSTNLVCRMGFVFKI